MKHFMSFVFGFILAFCVFVIPLALPKIDLAYLEHDMRSSAQDGEPAAQYLIARYILDGKINEVEPNEAFKWMLASASRDYVPAQIEMGRMYEGGVKVEKNVALAKHWYQRSLGQLLENIKD